MIDLILYNLIRYSMRQGMSSLDVLNTVKRSFQDWAEETTDDAEKSTFQYDATLIANLIKTIESEIAYSECNQEEEEGL